MTVLEIIMILVGVCFVFGSFMVVEKLSPREIDQLSRLSKDQMNRIVDSAFSDAKEKIQDEIDDQLDATSEEAGRRMDVRTNESLKSIGEYSQEVTEDMHKTHTEVMFLYSMLEDKEDELKKSVSNAMILTQKLNEYMSSLGMKPSGPAQKDNSSSTGVKTATQKPENITANEPVFKATEPSAPVLTQNSTDTHSKDNAYTPQENRRGASPYMHNSGDLKSKGSKRNSNDEILSRYRLGMTVVDIARELGLGKGEVQLVIDLYEGEKH